MDYLNYLSLCFKELAHNLAHWMCLINVRWMLHNTLLIHYPSHTSHLALDTKLWKYRLNNSLLNKQWGCCCRSIQTNWENHLKPIELNLYTLTTTSHPGESCCCSENKKQLLYKPFPQWSTLRSSYQNASSLRILAPSLHSLSM